MKGQFIRHWGYYIMVLMYQFPRCPTFNFFFSEKRRSGRFGNLKVDYQHRNLVNFQGVSIYWDAPRIPVANEGLGGDFFTENRRTLVVTDTGRGSIQMCIYIYIRYTWNLMATYL